MSPVLAESPHVARADLRAVAIGVEDGDGAVVGMAEGDAICPATGVPGDPQALSVRTKPAMATARFITKPYATPRMYV
jgi:hypothetical protein